MDTPASSLTLLKRYLRGHSLPSGWAEYAADGDYLIFYKISVNHHPDCLAASAEFLIKIDHDFSWKFSCHGTLVDINQCSVFGEVPGQLNSARAVLQVIDILQGYQPCIGNPVGDFGPLVLARGGVFNDSSGIAYYINVRDMIYYCAYVGTQQVARTDPRCDTIRHVDCEVVIPISNAVRHVLLSEHASE